MEQRKSTETKDVNDNNEIPVNDRSNSAKREHSHGTTTTDKSLSGNPTPSQNIQKGNASHASEAAEVAYSPSRSPPSKKTTSMVESAEANIAATNMALAHEIALSDFKLPDPNEEQKAEQQPTTPEGKIYKVIQETMHRAFWDSVKNDMELEPPVFDHIFVLIKEIKEILLSLLPANRITSLHTKINEGLDLDLLRQQADHDSLDVWKLSSFVIDLMASICAPARDEEVNNLRSIKDVVDLFKGIYRVLNLLKRDMANFAITSIRPHVQQQHVEYERTKFAQILAGLPNGLENTENWLNEARKEIQMEQKESTSASTPSTPISPLALLKKSYFKLLDWNHKTRPFPETVFMDEHRFMIIQSEFKRILLISSILLTSLTNFGAALSSQQVFTSKLKEDLLVLITPDQISEDHLPELLSSIFEHVWDSVSKFVEGKSTALVACTAPINKENLKTKIENLSKLRENPVYSILEKRGRGYLHTVAEHLAKNKSNSGPHEIPVPAGFQMFQGEILSLAISYAKLVNLNQLVYGPFYVPLLKKVLDIKEKANTNENTKSDTPKTEPSEAATPTQTAGSGQASTTS
uniref:T-complex protein 11-like protein 1 isoform X2 n=1 Tax=Ciona intestinalis TaxID=7719 RepID=UPI000521A624|nr:T-complex protein 11-like protein 1 isoform X2 [Ciona intestinalis]|eukprot:XP_009857670.1 T-complex protein 11-like protein 1 isoform X2 [Ciona intestinalis]